MQTSYQTLRKIWRMRGCRAFCGAEAAADLQRSRPEQKRSYTVETADSLGFISRKFYGDSSGIQKIMEANGLANADMIFEGQTLLIP